jgi:hypothetical protein
MSSTTKMLADPLWEITQGRMDLTMQLVQRATEIAAGRGHLQPLLGDFETAIERSASLARRTMRNPFRHH